jgi:ribosomal protein S18 acetylase RimI-like enzyme
MGERSPVAALHRRLDNPVWHALFGPQATLAEASGRAARFQPSVCMFAALPDEPDAAAWAGLADVIGAGAAAVLLRGVDPVDGWTADGWTKDGELAIAQMIWSPEAGDPPVRAPDALELGVDDVDDMLALVARTEPGPFEKETHRMGTYLGVRDGGELVAMAGTRLRLDGATEVSAVCTEEGHRGQGLAAALVGEMVARIQQRGDLPFLHVLTTNDTAIRVYERLGFILRRQLPATVVRGPALD